MTADPTNTHATTPNADTTAGWRKHPASPVLGGSYGTCFDIAMLKEGDRFRMWFSWRPRKSIALVESTDGIRWSEPIIALGPNESSGFEDDLNRPVVVKRTDGYHMWYTGQTSRNGRAASAIGYATSVDGVSWTRRSATPVLSPRDPWEKVAVMCPHVLWDDRQQRFEMWYSAGEQHEPDAIGYATSIDGLAWTRHAANPIFRADRSLPWEQHKVTACQVIRRADDYLMFYIGFHDEFRAQIGIARSRDGITNWERCPSNPIISPTPNAWDHDATYKPFAILCGDHWKLWYNGRRECCEQIGLAIHDGADLGF